MVSWCTAMKMVNTLFSHAWRRENVKSNRFITYCRCKTDEDELCVCVYARDASDVRFNPFFFYRDTPPRPKHLLLSTDRLMWLVETKNVQKKRGKK